MGKVDTAYSVRNIHRVINLLRLVDALPAEQRPPYFVNASYELAVAYGLSGQDDLALYQLERYFDKANADLPPVVRLAIETGFDHIRVSQRFRNLLETRYNSSEQGKYNRAVRFSRKELSYDELLELIRLLDNEKLDVYLTDKTIVWHTGDSLAYNPAAVPLPIVEHSDRYLTFRNCDFRMNFIWFNSGAKKQPLPFQAVKFKGCHFYGRFSASDLIIDERGSLEFSYCKFYKSFSLGVKLDFEEDWGSVEFSHNQFNDLQLYIIASHPLEVRFADNTIAGDSYLSIPSKTEMVSMLRNRFQGQMAIIIFEELAFLRIEESSFKNLLLEANLTNGIAFEKNLISEKLILKHPQLPENPANEFDWESISNFKLAILKGGSYGTLTNSQEGTFIISGDLAEMNVLSGEREQDIHDRNFRKLMGLYSIFLNLYKSKNDIESYNQCLIQTKDLQTKRQSYIYHSHPNFENFFRWKLSQMLKFYVRYGTDPARAIVISIYIITAFGVFFFFFPSDWDTTSKSKLVQNFNDFVQKNEKGYVKPFFILVAGFMVSLINAMTLSLNAFITLGFGNIPTHGIARYFCVLEGFLGWFLLSIFTVAMINQVL